MKTFLEALNDIRVEDQPIMKKHLSAAGIWDWSDFNNDSIYAFRDEVLSNVSPNSAKTIFAIFKAWLRRYEDFLPLPSDWRKILKTRRAAVVKVYLSHEELRKLEKVRIDDDQEKTVLYLFLIAARTGMRLSDTLAVTKDNIVKSGHTTVLSYVSKKTRIHAQVPVSKETIQMVEWVQENGVEIGHRIIYNRIVRRLCRRAGIKENVDVCRGGKENQGEKWRFVSSHTARISFCTNLAIAGVPVPDIMQLAGHSNYNMTLGYIVKHEVRLPKSAQILLGV